MNFREWISEISSNEWLVYIKRLSANDTGATDSNQVGVYFPNTVLATAFPSIDKRDLKNPDALFRAKVESDGVKEQVLRVIYYNSRYSENKKKGRNEKRITRWKEGVEYTPLQDPEKTGSLAIFAFSARGKADSEYMRVWVCRSLDEEEYLEGLLGEVSSQDRFFDFGDLVFSAFSSGIHAIAEKYPSQWNDIFPTGNEIIQYLFDKRFHAHLSPDARIIKRREHEFNLYKLVEKHHTLPMIKNGFQEVEDFIKIANSILNRRKSRSGKSLELHLEYIFREQGLLDFGVQCKTEGNKRPDFLFPNCHSYHDLSYNPSLLRMLAVKTTVKDRWRQILNEAKRLDNYHLFTLQQGVSENQFKEMEDESVQLVVPKDFFSSFPKSVQPKLMTLDSFIENTRKLYV